MKKKASIFRSLVLLLLVFVTVSSCCIGAMAIGFSGDSFVSSSGGSALSKTGFSVRPGGVKNLVVGYRFAGIKKDGNLADPTGTIHSVDVILSSKYIYVDGASNGDPPANYRLIPQWSKYEYFKVAWGGNVEGTTPVDFDILSTKDKKGWDKGIIFKEGDLGFVTALPMGDLSNKPKSSDKKTYKQLYGSLDLALDAWQDENDNIDVIARLVGFPDGLKGMVSGDTITIEPIYTIQIAGDCMLLTATEAAYMGGMYVYHLTNKAHSFDSEGWSYTGANLDDNGAGTWGAIGNFTNLRMCNLLYAPENKGLGWVDVSGPRSDVSGNRDRLTFYEILRGGWGVAICYQKTDEFDLSIDAIKFTSSSGDEVVYFDNQSYVPKLPHGETTTIYYLVSNNSKTGMYVDVYWASDKDPSMTARYTKRWLGAGESTWLKIGTRSASEDKQYRYTGWIFENGATSALREANSQNNTMTANFTVDLPKIDLKTVSIRYEYYDTNGNIVSQLVYKDASGNLKLKTSVYNPTNGAYVVAPEITSGIPVFPHNAYVYVYAVFTNTANTPATINCYYSNGGNDILIPTRVSTSGQLINKPMKDLFIAPGQQFEGHIGGFYAKDYGMGAYSASVYENKEPISSKGEINENDNTLEASYRVYGDVLVKDILIIPYVGQEDTNYIWQKETYSIFAVLENATPYPQVVDVYYSRDSETPIRRYSRRTIGPNREQMVIIASNLTEEELRSIRVTCEIYAYDLTGINSVTNQPIYTMHQDAQGKPTGNGECDESGTSKSSNNIYRETYSIQAEVGIVDIIFKNESDVEIPDTEKIKANSVVKVWFACTNPTTVDREVELFFRGEKVLDSEGNPATFIIPANTTEDDPLPIYVGEFTANYNDDFTVDGVGSVSGEIYRTGTDPDPGFEEDPDNNELERDYEVYFYDVAITDIFFEDAEGNVYGKGDNNSTSLLVGRDYKVYYTITNNSSTSADIGIYLNKVATTNNKLKNRLIRLYGGGVINATNGLVLTPGQSISVRVGQSEGANQNIGYAQVSGSVYIGNSLNADGETNAANNTLEEQIIFKHNVSIEEVYLTPLGSNQRFPVNSSDPSFVDIPVGTTTNVHYVLKNHTSKTIKVNIYTGSKPKIQTVNHGNYVITLNPMETKEVVLDKTLTLSATGRRMLVGSVYRDGYSPNADPYEMTFADNTTNCYYNGVVTPYIVPIIPNAPYREGTDVITSYYLINPTTKAYNGRPGATAEVRLTVKLKGTTKVIYEENKFTVVPPSCSTSDRAQLVYFKWSVPEDYLEDTDKFEVCADLFIPQYPDIGISYVSYSQDYINKDARFTPDTKYEDSQPSGWSEPTTRPVNSAASKKWNIWYFENGRFVQRNYGLQAAVTGGLLIKPDDKIVTAYEKQPNHWVMKAGYGVQVESLADCAVYRLTGYALLADDMYTQSQYSYMRWPEFQYSVNYNTPTISTLEKVGGKWMLPIFSNGDKVYGRVHFTPLWYPDGNYTAYACHSDIWTPMGMITVGVSDFIEIDGTAYDDWYIGHG